MFCFVFDGVAKILESSRSEAAEKNESQKPEKNAKRIEIIFRHSLEMPGFNFGPAAAISDTPFRKPLPNEAFEQVCRFAGFRVQFWGPERGTIFGV